MSDPTPAAAPQIETPAPVAATLSPVTATLVGWLAVALWNLGDIALLPLGPEGLSERVQHALVDLGHVLAVALPIVVGVALLSRFVPRLGRYARLAPTGAVLLAGVVFGPIVLVGDLEGAFERWMPDASTNWPAFLASAALAQVVTACFVMGRLFARPRWRSAAVAGGIALIAANGFVLPSGYPGIHVVLSVSGATLLAASQSGAPVPHRPAGRVVTATKETALRVATDVGGTFTDLVWYDETAAGPGPIRAVKVAKVNLEVFAKSREIAAETARLARVAFINGSGTSFDLVDTASRQRQAEIDLTVREFELLRARVAAFLALASCKV